MENEPQLPTVLRVILANLGVITTKMWEIGVTGRLWKPRLHFPVRPKTQTLGFETRLRICNEI